mmetsp:Transcript_46294/g.138391  ORF Transcript_46294/g.138391 Transcript_46294/m.138391 type:complete len:212 (-) Transcript_46294:1061-1696(-)
MLGDLHYELAHLLCRHVRLSSAKLGEKLVGLHALLLDVRPEGTGDGLLRVLGDLLPGPPQGIHLLLAPGVQRTNLHLQLDQAASGLAEGARLGGLDLVHALLDACLCLLDGLQRSLQALLGLVHGLQRVLQLLAPVGHKRLRSGQRGVHRGSARSHQGLHIRDHGRTDLPLGSLLPLLPLGLDPLAHALLEVHHLLPDLREGVLHLADPGP